ncbi:MAG: penicillin-binding protein 2 [Gemmatimonadota bacterium]
MKAIHPLLRKHRGRVSTFALLGMMGLLAAGFFRVQVVGGPAWALQAESNRLRVLPMPAPRGTIFDRWGRVIADNVPAYSVSLFPAPSDSIRATLSRLDPFLGLGEEAVEVLVAQAEADRRQPLVVLRDAGFEAVAAIEERRSEFPGVFLEVRPKRRYMGGAALGHVLGYVGEISGAELENPRFEGYEARMVVGKEGLERQYEEGLQGTQGVRFVEVDAVGRIVGSFEGQAATPAHPGEDLHLHLDLDLMEFIHETFPEGMRGAVVLLNAEDGGILALYSAPSFDPNEFVGGIDPQVWTALNTDPERPLFNRAVVGRYPPASTWKLATGIIGMELGELHAGEVMPVACTGRYTALGRTSSCWNLSGHGYLDLAGAIANSCNVYFYQVGVRVGLERLVTEGDQLGFNDRCGVDLPAESSGTFPDDLSFYERRFGYRPAENEVMSLSIGQGPNDQTPLRMAQFYLALGRDDGIAPAPRLAQAGAGAEAGPVWDLHASPETLVELRRGLRQVTSASGTAFRASLEHWDLIGKTGTAQRMDGEPNDAWFLGLAGPWGVPSEIVVAVIVEQGESGSGRAAPIAAKAADFYLRRKYDIPVDTIQTLGEHLDRGVPAPWARWSAP